MSTNPIGDRLRLPARRRRGRTSKWTRRLLALGFLLVFLGVIVWIYREHDTLVSDSPDGAYQVVMRERALRFIARPFTIFLVDRKAGSRRSIFRSNDQRPLIKNERLVWSEDSSRFALVGDLCFILPEPTEPSDEIVFLVYDIPSGKVWYNSDAEKHGYELFSGEEANAVFDRRCVLRTP